MGLRARGSLGCASAVYGTGLPFYDGVRMGLLIIQWYTIYLHMWPNNSTQSRRFVLFEFRVGLTDLVGGSTNETGILNAVE